MIVYSNADPFPAMPSPPASAPSRSPVIRRPSDVIVFIFLFAFASAFAFGGAWIVWLAIRQHTQLAASSHWPSVQCVVTSSEIHTEPGTGAGLHDWLYSTCEYDVPLGTFSFACGEGLPTIDKEFMKVHSRHSCQVNPDNPHEAIFEKGMFLAPRFGVGFGLFLSALGFLMLYGLVRLVTR